MDALVAELDDRVDHLLLLGLEDALLAAALDEDRAAPRCSSRRAPRSPAPSSRATRVVTAVRTRDERAEDAQQDVDRSRTARSANALGVGQGEGLGHELAEDDREQGQEEGHDR